MYGQMFATACIIFLAGSRAVAIFDEDVLLTAAMRVGAGPVIYRGFLLRLRPKAAVSTRW